MPPSLDEVLASSDEPTVVVPLLLSTGHHVRHDLPTSLAPAAGPVCSDRAPGAAPRLLAEAQADRLLRGGAEPGQPVRHGRGRVPRPAGRRRDLAAAARLLAETWRGPVSRWPPSGASARSRRSGHAGAVAVSPYLLADGHFADRLREHVPTGGVVADVIGAHPAVVALWSRRAGRRRPR